MATFCLLTVLLLLHTCDAQDLGKSEKLFNTPLALIIGAALIFLALFFALLAYLCCSGAGERIDQIYDGCTSSTAYYKYMIKFAFGNHTPKYTSKSTTIMIDCIDDSRMFITRIAIPPQWLSRMKAIPAPTKTIKKCWITKFQLNRGIPMPDVRFIRISHDCNTPEKQTIKIYYMEIKDLMANTITNIPIFTDIGVIGPDSSSFEQNFRAKQAVPAKHTDDDMFLEGITPYITFPEFAIFGAFYVCVCMFINLFIPFALNLTTIGRALVNGIVVSFISLCYTAIIVVGYKRGVKRGYASSHGTGAWGCIRVLFLIVVLILGLSYAVSASIIASYLETDEVINWSIAILVSILMLIVVFTPLCIVITKKTGYMEGDRIKPKQENNNQMSDQKPLPLGVGPKKA